MEICSGQQHGSLDLDEFHTGATVGRAGFFILQKVGYTAVHDTMRTVIILFGFTGDLAQKKLIRALHENVSAGSFNKPLFVGVHRRDWDDTASRDYVCQSARCAQDDPFLDLWQFVRGPLEAKATFQSIFNTLSQVGEEIRLVCHVALPVSSYDEIIAGMKAMLLEEFPAYKKNFCMLFEKPFGDDLVSSKRLFANLEQFLDEEQIFLVDHYMYKPGAYALAETTADEKPPREVHLKLLEDSVVGSRCTFYNPAGALKDVGQNHLLELCAQYGAQYISTPKNLKKRRELFLESLIPLTAKTIRANYERKQYEGYECTNFDGTGSDTETYFKLTVYSNLRRFAGTKFTLESGKGFAQAESTVVITHADGVVTSIPIALPKPQLSEYARMYQAAVASDFKQAVSKAEVLASWKLIDSVKKWEQEVVLGTYKRAK